MKHIALLLLLFCACNSQELDTSGYQAQILTADEVEMSGDLIHYWPNQDAVDNNRPAIMLVQRAQIGAQTMIHGRIFGPAHVADSSRGDPTELGYNPGGLPAIELAVMPEVGKATPRGFSLSSLADTDMAHENRLNDLETLLGDPVYAAVVMTGAGSLNLSSSFTALTGGSLVSNSSGISYTPGTGVLLAPEDGVYDLSGSATVARLVGLTAPDISIALFVNGAQTPALGQTTLSALADVRTIDCGIPLSLSVGDEVTLRIRSSLSLAIDTTRFQLSMQRRR